MIKSGQVTIVYFCLCSSCPHALRPSLARVPSRAAGSQSRNGFHNDRCSHDLPQVRAGLCRASLHESRSADDLPQLRIPIRVSSVPRGVVRKSSQRAGAPLSGSRHLGVRFRPDVAAFVYRVPGTSASSRMSSHGILQSKQRSPIGKSGRRHLVESWQGWIEVVPGLTPHRVGNRLRLVSAGVVEARCVDGEDIGHGRKRHVDR